MQDRSDTIEIEINLPAEAWPDPPPTMRVVPVSADAIDLSRAGSDPGLQLEGAGEWLSADDLVDEGGAT